VGAGQSYYRQAVHQGKFWGDFQSLQSFFHGEMGGPQNIQVIDFFHRTDAHPDLNIRDPVKFGEQGGPLFGRKGFGVGQAFQEGRRFLQKQGGGEQYGGSHHRSGQRTSSGLVHSGDTKNAAVESGVFRGQKAGFNFEKIR
jgi:hypothetical protein